MANAIVNCIDLHVGTAVREVRIANSVTLETLAESIDISPRQLDSKEHGESRFSAHELFLITRALEIDLQRIFDSVGAKRAYDGKFSLTIEANLADCDFVETYLSLSATHKTIVRLLAEELK